MKFSIGSLPAKDLLARGLLKFPEYQRDSVWSFTKRALLVDSMLHGLIVPPVFLAREGSSFLVIDGRQRLEAMAGFYSGDFTVSIDGVRFTYSQLPPQLRARFLGYLQGVVTIHEATDEELRELFLRLQLGMPLTAGEKLNITRGEVRKLVLAVRDHPFLQESSIYKRRNLAFTLSAQIVAASVTRARTGEFCRLQLPDLNRFLSENRDLGVASGDGKRILATLSSLQRAFGHRTHRVNRVVDVLSFYLFAEELNGSAAESKLGDFFVDFVEARSLARSGQRVPDAELVFQYEKACLEARETPKSIRTRHEILSRMWGLPVSAAAPASPAKAQAATVDAGRTRSFTFYCRSGGTDVKHQVSATPPEASVKLHDAQFPRHRFMGAKEVGGREIEV